MPAASKTARKQAAATQRARQRKDDLKNYWTVGATGLRFGNDEWRVRVFRGKGRQPLLLDDVVESISWLDNGPMLTGTLNIRKPATHPKLDVGEGHVARLEHRQQGGGAWREVWTMRLGGPLENTGVSIDPDLDTYSFQLADDLALLAKSKGSFKFKKDKGHPNGWTLAQVFRAVGEEWGFEVGPIPDVRHRFKKLSRTGVTPLDFLMLALRTVNEEKGRDYVLRWRQGKLTIVPKVRSEHLLELEDSILAASITSGRRADFASVLDVRGTTSPKKGKKRKIKTTVQLDKVVRRFGIIRRTITVDADSLAEARSKAKRTYARITRPKREVSFTHLGIPSLRRQASLKLHFPEQDFSELVYVTQVQHNVSPGAYTMDVSVDFTDPFEDVVKKKKAKKKAKAKEKADPKKAQPKATEPKKAAQRKDAPKPKAAKAKKVKPLGDYAIDPVETVG